MDITRRAILHSALGAGMAGLMPAAVLAQPAAPSAVVETRSGRVRGMREGAISTFRGIPYGVDTGGARRFLPPTPAESWTGMRDCLAFGHRAQPRAR